MGMQDDWMMRQIEMMTKFVAKVVFGKDGNEVHYELSSTENGEKLSSSDETFLTLCRLIKEGSICEAEDVLYENMEYSDRYIELATDFYRKLNDMTDEQLEAGDFSRDEICEGYVDIMAKLGVPIDVFGQADRSEY